MGFLESIFAGGATGLLGMGLQRVFDWLNTREQAKLQKLKFDHELAMRDKDAAIMREEWQGKLRVATQEGETAREVADSKSFETTMLREPERYSYAPTLTKAQQWILVLLDFFRGVVRPLLTVYLCLLTTYIWWQVRQLIAVEELDVSNVVAVWLIVVKTILYLTTTVVLWWFGTRNRQSAPQISRGP